MGYNLCFALFDEIRGPFVAFKRNLDEQLALKIALKTMIAVGSMDQTYSATEAIIAIPEEKVCTFFRFFSINDEGKRGGASPACLIFVTDITNQLRVYKDAPKLSELAAGFTDSLHDIIRGSSENQVELIEDFFAKKLSEKVLSSISFEDDQIISELTSQQKKTISPSLTLWKNFVDIDKLIRALLLKKPVVFILSDRGIVQPHLSNAWLFCPHRNPVIKEWTSRYDVKATIQFGSAELVKTVPPTVVIFNQVRGHIKKGKSNKFCLNLFQKLIQMDSQETSFYIKQILDELLSEVGLFLSQLADILVLPESDPKAEESYNALVVDIKNIRSKHELEIFEVLMNQTNPRIMERIKQRFHLGRTRIHAIQAVLIDEIGPAGKLFVKKGIEQEIGKSKDGLGSDEVPEFVKYIVTLVVQEDILDESEIQALQNRMLTHANDFHSVLTKVSIFKE